MSYNTHHYLLMTVDPVHIGTGGARLGRVDLSIVREPGTKLPKIPGTSLSGAIRQYAAYRYGKRQCAGQGQSREGREGHCGRPTCPICYTFGAITGERSYSGVVSIGDARLLLFPVYSMAGPVWVTGPSALADFGLKDHKVANDEARWSGITEQKHLNLGWLMVEKEGDLTLSDLPSEIPDTVRERIVLISDKLFSQVVNSNLEVRTSVSINPETGAAEEGALFTYEAIPRATFLWMDVVVDDFRGAFPARDKLEEWQKALEEQGDAGKELLRKWQLWKDSDGNGKLGESAQKALAWVQDDLGRYANGVSWQDPAGVITAGLEWTEHLGIGGMGTRGFGRVRMVDHWEVAHEETYA
ncbi:MAG: type III-B CRISPR module RAMP protein Cmr4 [Chloroflexi bacterium]|nr:MAG: type III-B CRISPR module RAMP protein Cmr4 [Chloroflexota bacterium]